MLTELIEYLRALVLYLAVPDYEEIYLTDTKEALAELAPLFGRDRLLAAEERLHSAIQELRGSMHPRITAELCLLDFAGWRAARWLLYRQELNSWSVSWQAA